MVVGFGQHVLMFSNEVVVRVGVELGLKLPLPGWGEKRRARGQRSGQSQVSSGWGLEWWF